MTISALTCACGSPAAVRIVHTFFAFQLTLCAGCEATSRAEQLDALKSSQGERRRAAIAASVRKDSRGNVDDNYFDWRTFHARFDWVER